MDKGLMLSKVAEHYGLTRNIDIAKFFELSPQTAFSWMKGSWNIFEIYNRCPDINPEWLLSLGEKGDMLRPEKVEAAKETETLSKALDNTKEALNRLADEQSISKGVLCHTERMLRILEEKCK